jgi:hypothetical protein
MKGMSGSYFESATNARRTIEVIPGDGSLGPSQLISGFCWALRKRSALSQTDWANAAEGLVAGVAAGASAARTRIVAVTTNIARIAIAARKRDFMESPF